MALEVTLTEEKDIVVIHLAGRIDSFVIDELNTGFDRAMKTGKKKILLLLKDLEYINSRGIGSLMSFFKWVKKSGGLVKIAEVPLNIMQVLNLLGLDGLTLMYDSRSDAIESFGRGRPVEKVPEEGDPPIGPPVPVPQQKGSRAATLFLGIGCAVLLALVIYLSTRQWNTPGNVDLTPLQARLERLEKRLGNLEAQDRGRPDITGQIQGLGKELQARMDRMEERVERLRKDAASVKEAPGRKPVAEKSPPKERVARYHRVRSGESLYRIGRRYQISVRELCRLNNISSNKPIHPGQKLIVGFSSLRPTPEHTSR